MPDSIQAQFTILFFLTLVSFLICFMAWKKKFFFLPTQKQKITISFLDLFLAFFLYFFSLAFLTPLIMKLFNVNETRFSEILYVSLANFLSLSISSIALYSYYFSKLKQFEKDIHLIPSKNFMKNIWVGCIGWVIAIPIVLSIHQAFDLFIHLALKIKTIPDQIAVQFLKSTVNHSLSFSLALISIIFFAPFIEELLFRGFLQNWLKKLFGRSIAIFISSICFSLFHFSKSQGVGNLSILFALFPLAFFLGFIYEKQRSLIAPITLHAVFNFTSVINLVFF